MTAFQAGTSANTPVAEDIYATAEDEINVLSMDIDYTKMDPYSEEYDESRSIWSNKRCAESKLKEFAKKGFYKRVEETLQKFPQCNVNATRKGGSGRTASVLLPSSPMT